MELTSGTLLERGKYRIIRALGMGGFGITYLAEHELAGRNVCIKEFFPKEFYNRDDNSHSISLGSKGSAKIMDAFKAKFIKEAKTIARLDHPNIIHIHDVFAENGTAYYVMEYVEGESLSALVRGRGALAEAEAIKYIRAVAEALDYIHERKIMHLDIKPANVMLRKVDGRAILIDFGLSKQYDEEGNQTSSTPVGISAGYAPMEQYQQGGVKEFSPETDIYSLGATLYYLVTGEVPPQAAAVVDNGLPELPAHLSSGVRNAIERSMEIQRKRRPHSIKEFLALLEDNTPKVAVPTPAPMPVSEETLIIAPTPTEDEKTVIGNTTPNATQPNATQPKKEWTPKYGVGKPMKSDDEKRKKSRWWLWLLIVAVVGGIGGFIALSGGNEENHKEAVNHSNNVGNKISNPTISKFFDAVVSKDVNAIKAVLHPNYHHRIQKLIYLSEHFNYQYAEEVGKYYDSDGNENYIVAIKIGDNVDIDTLPIDPLEIFEYISPSRHVFAFEDLYTVKSDGIEYVCFDTDMVSISEFDSYEIELPVKYYIGDYYSTDNRINEQNIITITDKLMDTYRSIMADAYEIHELEYVYYKWFNALDETYKRVVEQRFQEVIEIYKESYSENDTIFRVAPFDMSGVYFGPAVPIHESMINLCCQDRILNIYEQNGYMYIGDTVLRISDFDSEDDLILNMYEAIYDSLKNMEVCIILVDLEEKLIVKTYLNEAIYCALLDYSEDIAQNLYNVSYYSLEDTEKSSIDYQMPVVAKRFDSQF